MCHFEGVPHSAGRLRNLRESNRDISPLRGFDMTGKATCHFDDSDFVGRREISDTSNKKNIDIGKKEISPPPRRGRYDKEAACHFDDPDLSGEEKSQRRKLRYLPADGEQDPDTSGFDMTRNEIKRNE